MKIISTNPIKNVAFTLLMTSPFIYNNISAKNRIETFEHQTELVSKEASNAIVASVVTVPVTDNIRNASLDKKVRSFDITNEDKKATNLNIADAYSELGLYGATVALQHYVNQESIKKLMYEFEHGCYDAKYKEDKNYHKEDGKLIYEDAVKINTWFDKKYYPYARGEEAILFKNGKKPSFKEVSEFYDKYVSEIPFLAKTAIATYKKEVENFEKKQTNKNTQEGQANLIAFKVYMTEKLVFDQFLKDNPLQVKEAYHADVPLKPNDEYYGKFVPFKYFYNKFFVKVAKPLP